MNRILLFFAVTIIGCTSNPKHNSQPQDQLYNNFRGKFKNYSLGRFQVPQDSIRFFYNTISVETDSGYKYQRSRFVDINLDELKYLKESNIPEKGESTFRALYNLKTHTLKDFEILLYCKEYDAGTEDGSGWGFWLKLVTIRNELLIDSLSLTYYKQNLINQNGSIDQDLNINIKRHEWIYNGLNGSYSGSKDTSFRYIINNDGHFKRIN
jgi:hypothetical protein